MKNPVFWFYKKIFLFVNKTNIFKAKYNPLLLLLRVYFSFWWDSCVDSLHCSNPETDTNYLEFIWDHACKSNFHDALLGEYLFLFRALHCNLKIYWIVCQKGRGLWLRSISSELHRFYSSLCRLMRIILHQVFH